MKSKGNILSNLFNKGNGNSSPSSSHFNSGGGIVSKSINKAFSPLFRSSDKNPADWPNDDKHNQAKSFLSYANKYINSGNLDDAKYNAEQAAHMTSDAKTSSWYYCMAYINAKQHNYDEALDMYSGMLMHLSSQDKKINCLYSMADCAYKSNNKPAGDECLQKLCELTPNEDRPYRLLGIHAGDITEAHRYFQKAVSISKTGVNYWYLGKTEVNDANQRVEDIRTACLRGDYAKWWLSLGDTYYQMLSGVSDATRTAEYKQKATSSYARGISGRTNKNASKQIKNEAKGICAYHLHLFLLAHTLLAKTKDAQVIRYLAMLPLRDDIGPLDEVLTEPAYNRSPLVIAVQSLESGLVKITNDSNASMAKTYRLLGALCRRGGWYDQSVRCAHIAKLLDDKNAGDSSYTKLAQNIADKHHKDYTGQLNQLIGLDSVKSKISEFADVAMVQKIRSHRRGHEEMHLVFEGAPGTGKTTVANLMAGILYQKHIIQKPKLVAVNGSQITGQFYGQAAANIRRLIQKAMGGVLFIDEAYHLAHRNSHNGNSDFQDEAMNEFVPDIERYKNNLVVILAGYTDLMKNFLNHSNPGLSSRFPKSERIHFPNYSSIECIEILGLYLKEHGYTVDSDKTSGILSHFVASLVSNANPSTFGNARTIRNFYDVLYSVQNVRIANQYSVAQIRAMGKANNPALNTITAKDAKVAVKRCK